MPIYREEPVDGDYGNDAFWDLPANQTGTGRPERKKTALQKWADVRVGHSGPDTFSVPSPEPKPRRKNGKMPPEGKKTEQPELLSEYVPAQSLIRKVSVYRWPVNHTFYKNFVTNAHISHRTQGAPAPYEPYYSYIPQYSHLRPAQQKYYFYFRDCTRAGYYPKTDLAYLLLYVYEIINLPDLITPRKGLQTIWDLWAAYRYQIPGVDRYFSEWVVDYSLIYRIPLPLNHPELRAVGFRTSSVPEFYLTVPEAEDSAAEAGRWLVEVASDYDYRRSRWYASQKEIFDQRIPEAVAAAFQAMREASDGVFAPSVSRRMNITKDAFCGSLCEHNIKRRIHMEIQTFPATPWVRHQMTLVVKHAENRLRRTLGLSSVLKVQDLAESARVAVDRCFEKYGGENQVRKAPAIPAYEAQYDTAAEPVSMEKARAIESDSWEVTRQLVGEEPAQEIPAAPVTGTVSDDGWKELFSRLLEGGSLAEYCRERNLFPDELASRINEKAFDCIGDVVLEQTDGDWKIIEDYREDILHGAIC